MIDQDYCIAKAKAEAFVDGVSDLDADLVADAVEQAKADKKFRDDRAATEDARRAPSLLHQSGGYEPSEAERQHARLHQLLSQMPSGNHSGYTGLDVGIFGRGWIG